MNRVQTILIVEDESVPRLQMREVLEEAGYSVLEAADGLEGISLFSLHQDQISLVMLDLNMPHKSGYEVLAEMQIADPDVNVVVVTGYSPDEERLPGVKTVLNKPWQPHGLVSLVREILDDEE